MSRNSFSTGVIGDESKSTSAERIRLNSGRRWISLQRSRCCSANFRRSAARRALVSRRTERAVKRRPPMIPVLWRSGNQFCSSQTGSAATMGSYHSGGRSQNGNVYTSAGISGRALMRRLRGTRMMRSPGPQPEPGGRWDLTSDVTSEPIMAKSPSSNSRTFGQACPAGQAVSNFTRMRKNMAQSATRV